MKKSKKVVTAIVGVVVALSVISFSAAAALGFHAMVTLFKGRVAPLGVVTENYRVRISSEDRSYGRVADFTNNETTEFPILNNVKYDIDNGVWTSGDKPIETPTAIFKLDSTEGTVENCKLRSKVDGNEMLVPTIRVGVVLEYPSGEKKAAILNGVADTTATTIDLSEVPYSMNIGVISSDEPVTVTACAWVDKNALSQVDTYADDLTVSLIVY